MRFTKKSSLSLSVNAIVVLILAIVMLGLGLGFIKGMFGKVSGQLEQQISAEPNPSAPFAGEPLTLSRETLITRIGEREIIKVSILNPTDAILNNAKPVIDCGTEFPITEQKVNPKDIAQGKAVTFAMVATIPAVPANTYLCKMFVEGKPAISKDLTIRISQ
ncbi:hypothetical protein HYU14_04970 [Candidatus Woesearchaeota archaeon]|nr:hypothetical protein [Candidatus Woesearchaeota archaeon]